MNKLYRSQRSSMIAGVCGGLANYFGIDPTIIRLIFVFLAFYHFLGVWVYLVMVILLPQAPPEFDETRSPVKLGENSQTTRVIGGGLVVLGLLAVISTLDIPWFSWMSLENLWPVLIVLLSGQAHARGHLGPFRGVKKEGRVLFVVGGEQRVLPDHTPIFVLSRAALS